MKLKRNLWLLIVSLIVCMLISANSVIAEPALSTTETIDFMGMAFGAKLPYVQKELCSLGFNKNYVYRPYKTNLSTRITCVSHQSEMREAGFPYASAKNAAWAIELNIAQRSYGHKAYSVGGMNVSRIFLYFSPFYSTERGIVEIEKEAEYWLYAGTFAFDHTGANAINKSHDTYMVLFRKLQSIYGVPSIVESEMILDGKQVVAKHATWLGYNNTGIHLRYEPSNAQYSTVYLMYGYTDMYDLCVQVDNQLQKESKREGL